MGLGLELFTTLMDIDFLIAEAKRQSTLAKAFRGHTHDTYVKILAGVNISSGQYKMVQMINHGISSVWNRGLFTAKAAFRIR